MNTYRTIQRHDREAPNANGFYIQNRNGATIAGPFATVQQAWAEVDRFVAEDKASAELGAAERGDADPAHTSS